MTHDFTVASVNDDWETPGTNIPEVSRHVDLILAQECKYERHDPLGSDWGWHHVVANQAEAGSAVAWKRDVLTRRVGSRPPLGQGKFLGVLPGRAKMLARWGIWNELALVSSPGKRAKYLAIHRPPLRYKFLWPAFDAAVAARVHLWRRKGWEVLIGLDANSHNPQPLRRLTGLAWHHVGIDGLLSSPGLEIHNVRTLPKGTSDHHPVLADVTFKAK